ncbi:hypothetical protein Pmani_027797 [Petrolisthes manimaculis]|uniref:Uncharacterized protein n=1 Tax=Petrolisthes manimaculis TaxID=1843537 RepID=A0AAE1P306_9EUCA|nr:hypothetical protein Pmani_027797 [Petrolisthes manimaculis]
MFSRLTTGLVVLVVIAQFQRINTTGDMGHYEDKTGCNRYNETGNKRYDKVTAVSYLTEYVTCLANRYVAASIIIRYIGMTGNNQYDFVTRLVNRYNNETTVINKHGSVASVIIRYNDATGGIKQYESMTRLNNRYYNVTSVINRSNDMTGGNNRYYWSPLSRYDGSRFCVPGAYNGCSLSSRNPSYDGSSSRIPNYSMGIPDNKIYDNLYNGRDGMYRNKSKGWMFA